MIDGLVVKLFFDGLVGWGVADEVGDGIFRGRLVVAVDLGVVVGCLVDEGLEFFGAVVGLVAFGDGLVALGGEGVDGLVSLVEL